MTHDLFKSVLDDLGTKVMQVIITELHDGTFFAEIEFARDGGTYRISSRPSDAIALLSATATRSRSSPTRTCSRRPGCSSSRTRTARSRKSRSSSSGQFLDQVRPRTSTRRGFLTVCVRTGVRS